MLQPDGVGSRLHVSQRWLGDSALVGLTSTAIAEAPGTSSCNSSSRFAVNSAAKKLTPGKIAAWPVEASDETELDRVLADR